MEVEMTPLPKTWILDLDGTIVKHNGYKLDGKDSLLPGADSLLKQIAPDDMVVFITSRPVSLRDSTEMFLREHGIRFDHIIYEAPFGERILVNDRKPSGRDMAYAVNGDRDAVPGLLIRRNEAL